MKLILPFLIIILTSFFSFGQNLDNFSERTPFAFSGNISVGSSFYKAVDREDRRSPFAYYIVASPTISIYEFDFPITFSYRDQQGSISKPFNRFTINPTYKWIKLGIGNTSLDLSSYTLSGQYFKGASMELTPGKFRIKAGYGELENPLSQIDTLIGGPPLILETYKRMAMSVLIGYGSNKNYIDLIAFRAKDDISSVDLSLIDNSIIKPEENLVFGTKFGVSPIKQITLKVNVAGSAYTSNQQSVGFESGDAGVERLDEAITNNISTKIQFAGDASIGFKIKKFGVGFEYKRVDPLYKSLGTYYFQEDYHNLTMKMNFSLFKSKIRFRGSGGLQENNLNNLRSNTRRRQIFKGSLTIAPSRKFTSTIRVANFTSDRTPVLNTLNDSLKFTQTTESYNFTPSLILTGKKINTVIVFMANYQKLIDLGTDLTGSRDVDNYTASLSYNMTFKESKLSLAASLLGNQNLIGEIENTRLGGNVSVSKKLFDDKFTISTNGGLTQNYINKALDGNTITGNISLRYRLKKSINVSLRSNILVRKSDIVSYQEYRGTAKITYQFNTNK